MMILEEWKEKVFSRGTSGDMVYDILRDWERNIEFQQQEIEGWRGRYDELDTGHSKLFKNFCELKQENERLEAQIKLLEFKSESEKND